MSIEIYDIVQNMSIEIYNFKMSIEIYNMEN